MEKEIEREEQREEEPQAEAAGPPEEVEPAEERPRGERPPVQRREAAEGGDTRPRRRGRGRRRPCVMCVERMSYIDYKDFSFLRRYLSDRGRIESRRKSGTCAKHQRALAQAIKRARHLALLPFTAEHVRTMGSSR